ncbi:hypothetical protein [Microvirus mar18]|uniref:Uncharacterized protein n=1 Tax=Microvirus mar18 TaxID=2851150 RepID=A0A8F5MK47_9VIRU|nr:hypothetical protein [Microvirus mar18]
MSLSNLDDILSLCSLVCACVFSLITFFRTGSLKTSVNKFMEFTDMKTRAPDYREKQVTEARDENGLPLKGGIVNSDGAIMPDPAAQSFTNMRTEYKLDKRTNTLVELPDKTDLQELINSAVSTAFEQQIARLLVDHEQPIPDTNEQDYEDSVDDLMDFAAVLDRAEEYREKLGLPLEMPVTDVFAKVQSYSEDLKKKLSAQSAIKKEEVKENAPQENDPKGE